MVYWSIFLLIVSFVGCAYVFGYLKWKDKQPLGESLGASFTALGLFATAGIAIYSLSESNNAVVREALSAELTQARKLTKEYRVDLAQFKRPRLLRRDSLYLERWHGTCLGGTIRYVVAGFYPKSPHAFDSLPSCDSLLPNGKCPVPESFDLSLKLLPMSSEWIERGLIMHDGESYPFTLDSSKYLLRTTVIGDTLITIEISELTPWFSVKTVDHIPPATIKDLHLSLGVEREGITACNPSRSIEDF